VAHQIGSPVDDIENLNQTASSIPAKAGAHGWRGPGLRRDGRLLNPLAEMTRCGLAPRCRWPVG
jgi:hypothetical protein